MNARGASLLVVLALAGPAGCRCADERVPERAAEAGTRSATAVQEAGPAPRTLYLQDASAPSAPRLLPPAEPTGEASRCPPEMLEVGGAFCVDRFEATLIDVGTGERLSPHYPPSPEATRREYRRWQVARESARTAVGREMAVPAPPEWALAAARFEPMATSVRGSVPNGYLSGEVASRACVRAGKRLCSVEEWVTACRGRRNTAFPYGHHHEAGRCNVSRETHPARVLHGSASIGHLDPRLHLVSEDGVPLLRPAGDTSGCESEWEGGSLHDMVGNLDEWVEDPQGTFVGGFYARATQKGCDARVEVHSFDYYDYSLGVRCCRGL